MAGTVRAAERTSELRHLHPGLKARRIDLLRGRQEQRIHARGFEQACVARVVARIFLEVAPRVELNRIDEDRHGDRVAVPLRLTHQRQMPLVKCPHGRHQGDRAAALPLLVGESLHLGDGGDGAHQLPVAALSTASTIFGEWKECVSVGNVPLPTSSTYCRTAPVTISLRFTYRLENFGANLSKRPSRSCITSTCPSQ